MATTRRRTTDEDVSTWMDKLEARSQLEKIEDSWCGPMGNSLQTRIRFAMWNAAQYFAEIADRKSHRASAEIRKVLAAEKARYDSTGHRMFRTPSLRSTGEIIKRRARGRSKG